MSPFREYLEHRPQQWFVSFQKQQWLVPLAVNAEGEAVAFSLADRRHQSYFLPAPVTGPHTRIFLENLLEAISRSSHVTEPAPSWTEIFQLPGIKDLKEKIEKMKSEVSTLEEKVSAYQSDLDRLTWIRNTLLSSDGKNLEEAVKVVLEAVGYHPVPGPKGQQDLTFEHKGTHFLAEVKGATSSASEDHIKQLQAKKTLYIEENKKDVKGVLIINAWRQYEPGQRENGGRVIFPAAIMPLVEIWNFSLITTTQLLEIYRRHLEGSLDRERLAKEIYDVVGPLKGYEMRK